MILVTGATGFVGSEIVRQLVAQGKKVRAIKRATSNTRFLADCEGKFEWMDADILDIPSLEKAFQGVEYVIHSAAMISFNPAMTERMHKINIEGTANMVNLALDFGVKKYVQVSSVSAYGRYEIKQEIDEKLKWKEHKDNTQYAISKFRAELEVWRAQEEGLSTVIVNPSTILGVGDWTQGSCQIFKNVYDEIAFHPVGINGFVDVKDVADICIQLMESDIEAEKFIACAENHTFKDIFFKIADAFGKKRPSKPIPPILASIGWRYYWLKSKLLGQQPMVTKETVTYTARDYV
ncbi:MAG: SDR family NAD(P)-dependent oxidoreductase, partial [Chitinophagales bacterium]